VWAHAIWGEAFPSLFEENWEKYISLKKGKCIGDCWSKKKVSLPQYDCFMGYEKLFGDR
jgi:hypothetical protein